MVAFLVMAAVVVLASLLAPSFVLPPANSPISPESALTFFAAAMQATAGLLISAFVVAAYVLRRAGPGRGQTTLVIAMSLAILALTVGLLYAAWGILNSTTGDEAVRNGIVFTVRTWILGAGLELIGVLAGAYLKGSKRGHD